MPTYITSNTKELNEVWSPSGQAFFAFLRAGEMTIPNNEAFNKSVHLSFDDVAVDDPKNFYVIQIKIKQLTS